MNNELIKNLEYVDRLTPEGRKHIKEYVIKLEQENKELHNKIDKAIEYIEEQTEGYDTNPIEGTWLYDIYKIEEILKDSDVDE